MENYDGRKRKPNYIARFLEILGMQIHLNKKGYGFMEVTP